MTSRNSSNDNSTNSNGTVEEFSVKKYGSTFSIVFLLIVIGVLSYFLWQCRSNVKNAIAASNLSNN